MADFISALNTGLAVDNLWGAISGLAPLMITLFLFSFAYYVFRKLFKSGRKGKANV